MEILFIDESEYNKKSKKDCLILAGLSVQDKYLLELEEGIRDIKERNYLNNLKELRTTREIKTDKKIEITKEITNVLEKSKASLNSIIFGDLEKNYEKNYFGSITFIIERFFLKIKEKNQIGLIICDSLPPKISLKVSKECSDYYLKECNIYVKGEDRGRLKDKIYPALFFQDDKYSNILQIVDLVCTSLQCAVREFNESNKEGRIKDNEDLLKDFSPYIECYWKFFDKNPWTGSVSGWGIKTWD